MNCDQIQPNLYVGSCPATSDEVETLKECGMTAVLNLQSDADIAYHAIDWPGLQACYSSVGIEICRVPITDFDDASLRDRLPEAVRVLTELLHKDHVAFVHCNVGVNRSPSVIISVLHWVEGWDFDEAVQHVCQCHSCSPVIDVIRTATWDQRRGAG
jgi:atypical dual specificity phosphatase